MFCRRSIILLILLLFPARLPAFDFTLHKQQGAQPGPTLLIVGGIQGDEPGGFNAAALLATRYRVQRGNLWVVPNLNFPSILQRSRGIYGDMNRKFDTLPESDPEYHQIARIKQIIMDPQVDLVFNLHDGSGFYHPEQINRLRNPNRWGQSCIIDQSRLPDTRFGNLEELTRETIQRVNTAALSPEHQFHLKNTRTAAGDIEMQRSLTYYAVRNNKPAFGIEASKSFSTPVRAYYLLSALEAYMEQVGLRFSRDFALTPQGIKQALSENVRVSFGGGRIQLELKDLRPTLNYFPLPKAAAIDFSSNNPLVAVLPYRDRFRIHYGNHRLSFLKPQYFAYDQSLTGIKMLIDGVDRDVKFGTTVPVDNNFLVRGKKGYRVNVIGFQKSGRRNESDLQIAKPQIAGSFSIDKSGNLFRVEVYRQNRFSGMVLVDFRRQTARKGPLVAQAMAGEQRAAEHEN
ncbi:MAG: deacylase [Deltaproteobacteria bacterium]|nr:deacylase [Deltaproteobacteria bacterium]